MLWTRLLYDTTFICRKNVKAFLYHTYENTTQQIYVQKQSFFLHISISDIWFSYEIFNGLMHIFSLYIHNSYLPRKDCHVFFFHPLSGIYQANIFSVVWQKCRNKSFGWYLCRNTNRNSFLMIYSCCLRKVCTKTEKTEIKSVFCWSFRMKNFCDAEMLFDFDSIKWHISHFVSGFFLTICVTFFLCLFFRWANFDNKLKWFSMRYSNNHKTSSINWTVFVCIFGSGNLFLGQ